MILNSQFQLVVFVSAIFMLSGCSVLSFSSVEDQLQAVRDNIDSHPLQAEQDLKDLKQQYPKNSEVWLLSGQLAMAKQRCDQAEIAFKQAQRYGSSQEIIFLGLGICADKNSEHMNAENYYRQGIERFPYSWRLQNNLAYSRLLRGQVVTATTNLISLSENFNQAEIRHNLAIAYAMQGDFERAYEIERLLYDEKTALKNRKAYQQLWQQ